MFRLHKRRKGNKKRLWMRPGERKERKHWQRKHVKEKKKSYKVAGMKKYMVSSESSCKITDLTEPGFQKFYD